MHATVPPIDERILRFQLPAAHETVLGNGLRLAVFEHRQIPKVYLRLGFSFGEKHDVASHYGGIELMARTLKKGTENYEYREFVERVESLGGSLDVGSSQDFFYVFGEFLSEHISDGMAMLAELLQKASFPNERVSNDLSRMVADLENEKSSPAFLAHKHMQKAMFNPHPYSYSKTEASLGNLTREYLAETRSRLIAPGCGTLVIGGDISAEMAEKLANTHFGEWVAPTVVETGFDTPAHATRSKLIIVDRPASEQVNLLIGNSMFSRTNNQYEIAAVANKILGGGSNGRLFMSLREDKGYTYGAYSSLALHKDAGMWISNAEVRQDVVTESMALICEEYEQICETPVGTDELQNAKRYLLGTFPLQHETPSAVCSLMLWRNLYGWDADYWDAHLAKIGAVTPEEIQTLTRFWLRLDALTIVAVGKAEDIQQQLGDYGPATIYHVNGDLIA